MSHTEPIGTCAMCEHEVMPQDEYDCPFCGEPLEIVKPEKGEIKN